MGENHHEPSKMWICWGCKPSSSSSRHSLLETAISPCDLVYEALELPPAPPVQSGALFFKRTQQLTAPDEVDIIGPLSGRSGTLRVV